MNLKDNSKKINLSKFFKIVCIVFAIQTFIVFSVFIVMKFIFKVDDDFFLADDGYLYLSSLLYYGKGTISGNVRGPFIPIIYSVIYLFPDFLFPVIRLLIVQLFTFGNIIFAYLIFNRIFKDNEEINSKFLYYGLLFFFLNPLYLYCTLKSTPEVYITFFILSILFFTYKYIECRKIIYLIFCVIFYGLSFYVKPVLILIPISLLIYYLLRKKFNLALFLLLVNLINTFSFYSFVKFTESKFEDTSFAQVDYAYVRYTYLVKNIFQYRNFNICGFSDEREQFNKFILENKNRGFFERNYNFIKEEPVWFIVARVFSPVLFFSLYTTTEKSIFFLILNTFILITAFLGIRCLKKDKREIELINFINVTLLGYFILHILTFSYLRYAMPVISIFSVYSTYTLFNYFKSKSKAKL
jgi:hypothetical protein